MHKRFPMSLVVTSFDFFFCLLHLEFSRWYLTTNVWANLGGKVEIVKMFLGSDNKLRKLEKSLEASLEKRISRFKWQRKFSQVSKSFLLFTSKLEDLFIDLQVCSCETSNALFSSLSQTSSHPSKFLLRRNFPTLPMCLPINFCSFTRKNVFRKWNF